MILYYTRENGQLKQVDQRTDRAWINISPPFIKEELNKLSIDLSIPLDFLTDSLDVDERSRYEREDDVRLIVLNSPVPNESNKDNEAIYITVPIGIIITIDHVITITAAENPVLQQFLESKVRNFKPEDEQLFVLQIFEKNVLEFLACLKKLNLKRHIIEQELYDSSKSSELKQLLRIEKSLVYMLSSLSSNELLKMKMKRTDFLKIKEDEFKMDLFEDIIIDNSQALEMANIHTNILSGTMEAYASIISNNLNIFIQRLTLITIVLMVPTLVASFYGMNVPVPMENSPYAFPMIVFISIVVSLFLVWFFLRKKLF